MKPYLDSDMQSRWWDFGGDAIVRTDKYVLIFWAQMDKACEVRTG